MADSTKNDHYNGVNFTAQAFIVTVTNALSIYNGVELLLLILVTFRRYAGLYFWSLFWSSFGVLPYSLGYVMSYFELTRSVAGLSVNNVGWWLMVTGQSFVLYSRLHLVLHNQKILRAILAMIIIDAIIFHVPTTVLNFVANYDPRSSGAISAEDGYKVYEKVQMTGFCIQEFIISGLYLWQTVKLLNVVKAEYSEARRTMWQLATINIIIVVMDVALLGIEYGNQRVYEQVFKGVFYSVKLKLEFAILGKLVQIVDKNHSALNRALGPADSKQDPDASTLDFVDRSKSADDPRYAASLAADRSKSRRSRKSSLGRGRTQHVEEVGSTGNGSVEQPEFRQRRKSSSILGVTSNQQRLPAQQRHMTLAEALAIDDDDDSVGRARQDREDDGDQSEGDMYAEVMRQMSRTSAS